MPLPEDLTVPTVVIGKAMTMGPAPTAAQPQFTYGCVAGGAPPTASSTIKNAVVTAMALTIDACIR